MIGTYNKMTETLDESQEVMGKMNELTDNMILARNVALGSLCAYAGFQILSKYFLTPFWSTFQFLINQTNAVRKSLKEKYGK